MAGICRGRAASRRDDTTACIHHYYIYALAYVSPTYGRLHTERPIQPLRPAALWLATVVLSLRDIVGTAAGNGLSAQEYNPYGILGALRQGNGLEAQTDWRGMLFLCVDCIDCVSQLSAAYVKISADYAKLSADFFLLSAGLLHHLPDVVSGSLLGMMPAYLCIIPTGYALPTVALPQAIHRRAFSPLPCPH